MDDNQQRLRQFGVLDRDQSTLYEYDNPMRTNEPTDDEMARIEMDINTDDFWTFDQFESQAEAHDAAAEYNDELEDDQ